MTSSEGEDEDTAVLLETADGVDDGENGTEVSAVTIGDAVVVIVVAGAEDEGHRDRGEGEESIGGAGTEGHVGEAEAVGLSVVPGVG
jgi:hypothetical protein